MKTYRQGEVFVVEIDKLPSRLKQKNNILAEGETTGHKHQLIGKNAQVYVDNNNGQYLQVKQETQLVHEEHKAIMIPTGAYKVVLQREYDLLTGIRTVLD